MWVPSLLARVLVIVASGLSWLGSGHAPATPDPVALHPLHGAWVVGDSITYEGGETLRPLLGTEVRGAITIDGVPGRSVAELPTLLGAELSAKPLPDVMVLALGTNTAPGWSESDYQQAVDEIPATTLVVLVTTYGAVSAIGPQQAQLSATYSQWLRDVAATRPRTCVADWRGAVQGHPELLRDGVHPTIVARDVWAQVIDDAVRRCELGV